MDKTAASSARWTTDKEIVFEFFCTFSRFEYALKRDKFLKESGRSVVADWDRYSNSIRLAFSKSKNVEFLSARTFLMAQPPFRQCLDSEGHLDWCAILKDTSELHERYILRLVQTVRNNLFHGGKYPYPQGAVIDQSRNRELIEACLCILRECLSVSAGVRLYYEDAA